MSTPIFYIVDRSVWVTRIFRHFENALELFEAQNLLLLQEDKEKYDHPDLRVLLEIDPQVSRENPLPPTGRHPPMCIVAQGVRVIQLWQKEKAIWSTEQRLCVPPIYMAHLED